MPWQQNSRLGRGRLPIGEKTAGESGYLGDTWMNMNRILAVAVGGMIGSVVRYLISGSTSRFFGRFPLGTLIVNIVGSLLIGFVMESSTGFWPISANMRVFLTTGVMGGLTTFSTFSYETVSFVSEGEYLMGGCNAGLNLFLALFACWGGRAIAQSLGG